MGRKYELTAFCNWGSGDSLSLQKFVVWVTRWYPSYTMFVSSCILQLILLYGSFFDGFLKRHVTVVLFGTHILSYKAHWQEHQSSGMTGTVEARIYSCNACRNLVPYSHHI